MCVVYVMWCCWCHKDDVKIVKTKYAWEDEPLTHHTVAGKHDGMGGGRIHVLAIPMLEAIVLVRIVCLFLNSPERPHPVHPPSFMHDPHERRHVDVEIQHLLPAISCKENCHFIISAFNCDYRSCLYSIILDEVVDWNHNWIERYSSPSLNANQPSMYDSLNPSQLINISGSKFNF